MAEFFGAYFLSASAVFWASISPVHEARAFPNGLSRASMISSSIVLIPIPCPLAIISIVLSSNNELSAEVVMLIFNLLKKLYSSWVFSIIFMREGSFLQF